MAGIESRCISGVWWLARRLAGRWIVIIPIALLMASLTSSYAILTVHSLLSYPFIMEDAAACVGGFKSLSLPLPLSLFLSPAPAPASAPAPSRPYPPGHCIPNCLGVPHLWLASRVPTSMLQALAVAWFWSGFGVTGV